jgi:hypothetical protein
VNRCGMTPQSLMTTSVRTGHWGKICRRWFQVQSDDSHPRISHETNSGSSRSEESETRNIWCRQVVNNEERKICMCTRKIVSKKKCDAMGTLR